MVIFSAMSKPLTPLSIFIIDPSGNLIATIFNFLVKFFICNLLFFYQIPRQPLPYSAGKQPSVETLRFFRITKPVFMGFVGLFLYLLGRKWWYFPLLFLEIFNLVLVVVWNRRSHCASILVDTSDVHSPRSIYTSRPHLLLPFERLSADRSYRPWAAISRFIAV